MMKKKVLSVFLCAGLAVSMLAGCGSGNSDTKDKKDAAADSDLEYVKDKEPLLSVLQILSRWIIKMIMETGSDLMQIWLQHLQKN